MSKKNSRTRHPDLTFVMPSYVPGQKPSPYGSLHGLSLGQSISLVKRGVLPPVRSERERQLRSRYNMLLEDYDQWMSWQDGVCAVCGDSPRYDLYVDHDHKTGAVRGLLCGGCNTLVGTLEHRWSLTQRAIKYLIPRPAPLDEHEVRETNATTGGAKGKKDAQFSLIPTEALSSLARLYGRGANKYGRDNWRKGYSWSLSYDAMMRHLYKFWMGEDKDTEIGESHLTAVAFHAFTLMTFVDEHPELDDRNSNSANSPRRVDNVEEEPSEATRQGTAEGVADWIRAPSPLLDNPFDTMDIAVGGSPSLRSTAYRLLKSEDERDLNNSWTTLKHTY